MLGSKNVWVGIFAEIIMSGSIDTGGRYGTTLKVVRPEKEKENNTPCNKKMFGPWFLQLLHGKGGSFLSRI